MYTWLPEKIEQAQKILKSRNIKLRFKFDSPASQGEI